MHPEIISISVSLEGHFLISGIFVVVVVCCLTGVGEEETEQK